MSSGKNAKRAGSTSQVWGYVIVLAAALAFILSMYVCSVYSSTCYTIVQSLTLYTTTGT